MSDNDNVTDIQTPFADAIREVSRLRKLVEEYSGRCTRAEAELARMKVRLEAAVAPPDYLERCAAEDAARQHMTGAVIISEDGCSGDTRIFTRASVEAGVDALLERRRRLVQP